MSCGGSKLFTWAFSQQPQIQAAFFPYPNQRIRTVCQIWSHKGKMSPKRIQKFSSQFIWPKTGWSPEPQSTAFSDLIFTIKKWQNSKNKVTFISEPEKVLLIRVCHLVGVQNPTIEPRRCSNKVRAIGHLVAGWCVPVCGAAVPFHAL